MALTQTWAVDERTDEAIIGWRSWRVMPFARIGQPSTYRLAPCGAHAAAAFWPPLAPIEAVCAYAAVGHAAPWPDHSCGLYAYAEREQAWEHLQSFLEWKKRRGAIAWAFGRVSLWGTTIEHEDGWRAQLAYPFELTVHGSPDVAEAIQALYRVEVAKAEPFPEPEGDEDNDPVGTDPLGSIATRLDRISAILESKKPTTENVLATRETRWLPSDVRDADYLKAMACLIDGGINEEDQTVTSREVADLLAVNKYAPDDSGFPLSDYAAPTAGRALGKLAVSGRIVRLKANPARWTLPGIKLTGANAELEPWVNRFAERDREVFAAFKRAWKARPKGVDRIRSCDVAACWRDGDTHVGTKVKVAHALGRLADAGQLIREQIKTPRVETWRPV